MAFSNLAIIVKLNLLKRKNVPLQKISSDSNGPRGAPGHQFCDVERLLYLLDSSLQFSHGVGVLGKNDGFPLFRTTNDFLSLVLMLAGYLNNSKWIIYWYGPSGWI